MINVSNEFLKLMNKKTDFKQNAEIAFADGTVLNLKEKDFTVSNNILTDASETSGIPLGVAVCRSIQIELMNDDDRFSEYDFFGATIRLYLTFQLSETVEKIEYGTFTVLTPETYGTTVIITALDDMYKADRDYSTNITYPASLQTILVDACNTLDISLGSTSFHNSDFVVNEKPTDITFRQMFGYIAMIAGGNARIDTTGRMRILSYDFEKLERVSQVIDGGIYSPWNNPIDLDGGSFNPWNLGDVADGGTFTDRNEYHSLSNWSNLKIDTDDVVITGVQTTYTDKENEEHTVMYGVEGYVLAVENPLIVGQEKFAVGLIGNVMVGGRFRQFSGDLVSNPTIEFMDIAVISDRKGNMYASFMTDITFQFFGFTTLKNSAEPALRNSAKPYSDATKTLVKARELVKNERTAREQAVAQLAKDLKNSSGLFMTEDVQPDGSTIYYMHDKPTLAESMIVWKLTALAFGISTDGGNTYPYGFTVDGTTITRLLYAEGIDADYIDTGAIRITDTNGNTMFLADYDTKEVYINASNVKIGTKAITDELVEMAATISLVDNKVELKASKGELSSLLSVESGEISIKSNRFSWDSTYSSLSSTGKLKATDVDLTGKITASSGKIGGFDIGNNYIYTNSAYVLGNYGVHIGTDGISCVGAFGKTIIKSDGSAEFETDEGIKIYNSDNYSYVTAQGISIKNSNLSNTEYFEKSINCFSDYEIKAFGITLDANSTGSRKVILKAGSTTYLDLSPLTSYIYGGDVGISLGKYGKKIGFFGNEGSIKKSISTITSTSTATTQNNAAKINEIILALQAYNLVG